MIPDYITPLIGWRCWSGVDLNTGGLRALTQGYYWLPKQVMALKCSHCGGPIKPLYEPPKEGEYYSRRQNNEGFYAFKTFHHLVEDKAFGEVVGTVYLWGQIVEATRGYRAEFAYPKELIASEYYAPILREKWGIPVEVGDVRQIWKQAREKMRQKIEAEEAAKEEERKRHFGIR